MIFMQINNRRRYLGWNLKKIKNSGKPQKEILED